MTYKNIEKNLGRPLTEQEQDIYAKILDEQCEGHIVARLKAEDKLEEIKIQEESREILQAQGYSQEQIEEMERQNALYSRPQQKSDEYYKNKAQEELAAGDVEAQSRQALKEAGYTDVEIDAMTKTAAELEKLR